MHKIRTSRFMGKEYWEVEANAPDADNKVTMFQNDDGSPIMIDVDLKDREIKKTYGVRIMVHDGKVDLWFSGSHDDETGGMVAFTFKNEGGVAVLEKWYNDERNLDEDGSPRKEPYKEDLLNPYKFHLQERNK